ncbi:hypothetical protein SY89_02006 [Halolamina pelagica]|uniref:ParB/Sulfiredoxin domain-containing protein n=1 Tax=Halolamina pelagica TaxID=699431 RepID=A0A0P7HW48_9EURY|nr:hypothetical protein [Halolamina pelagica]KPN31263.1 hypothetical protein SY89_02006 [Halolamina pelagica]
MDAAVSAVDDRLRAVGQRLVDRHPQWESLLLRARDGYARGTVRLRWVSNRLRYAAPPAPYRLLPVDPAAIERTVPVPGPKFKHAGAVVGGDWDRGGARFAELDVFRAYERHFEAGVPWQETAFYDRVVDQIEAGSPQWGCRTRREFDERCERLDTLYDRIAADGYRTQAELHDGAASDPIEGDDSHDRRALKTERFKHEIAVHVDRDGELLFADGRNRLSIAKLLGLDTVPVRVLRRHRRWQAVRDAWVRGHQVPPPHRNHPDLAGLERGDR